MRSSRGYAEGLGTAGSVVIVAAVLFVLGSAVVAFRGWPRMDSAGASAAPAIAAHPLAASRDGQRLAAAAPATVTVSATVSARSATSAGSRRRATHGSGRRAAHHAVNAGGSSVPGGITVTGGGYTVASAPGTGISSGSSRGSGNSRPARSIIKRSSPGTVTPASGSATTVASTPAPAVSPASSSSTSTGTTPTTSAPTPAGATQ